MIDLPDLADKLNQYGLLNKSFMDMTKPEILQLISAVFSSPSDEIPPEGWQAPFIDEQGDLVLTFNSHPKYHWWTADGQSLQDTLIEIGAPYEVAKKYLCSRLITEEAYNNKLIPF